MVKRKIKLYLPREVRKVKICADILNSKKSEINKIFKKWTREVKLYL